MNRISTKPKRKRRKYYVVEKGEWRAPCRRGYKSACCDCGLVHTMNFRLHKDRAGRNQIQMQAFRDNRATGALRRYTPIADFTEVLTAIKRKLGRRHVPVLKTFIRRRKVRV